MGGVQGWALREHRVRAVLQLPAYLRLRSDLDHEPLRPVSPGKSPQKSANGQRPLKGAGYLVSG